MGYRVDALKPHILPAFYIASAVTGVMMLIGPSWFQLFEAVRCFLVTFAGVLSALVMRLVHRDEKGRLKVDWPLALVTLLVIIIGNLIRG